MGTGKRKPGFWREGRWVLVLMAAGVVLPGVWWAQRIRHSGPPRVGDGKNPSTYGFPLKDAKVDLTTLVGAGFPRDGIPALSQPESVNPAEVTSLGRRFLLPGDPVLGVNIAGKSKAYPLRVLAFHEVINDNLGGKPIVVVHQPLCGFSAVFSRELGDHPPVFAVSGLVWNSCGLIYRKDHPQEGLYLPLLGKAITGPGAKRGEKLVLVPFTLTSWRRWLSAHPETTLVRPDMEHLPQYKRDPYSSYFGSELLRFPVSPLLPPTARVSAKSKLLVLWPFQDPVVLPLEALNQRGITHLRLRGVSLQLTPLAPHGLAELTVLEGESPPVIYAFAFAWFAANPGEQPEKWGVPAGSPSLAEKTQQWSRSRGNSHQLLSLGLGS